MSRFREVEFQGERYLFIGDDDDSPLATKEQYENGHESFAHLLGNDVWRHGAIIGSRNDLRFTGQEIDVTPTEDATGHLLSGMGFVR